MEKRICNRKTKIGRKNKKKIEAKSEEWETQKEEAEKEGKTGKK